MEKITHANKRIYNTIIQKFMKEIFYCGERTKKKQKAWCIHEKITNRRRITKKSWETQKKLKQKIKLLPGIRLLAFSANYLKKKFQKKVNKIGTTR